MMLTRQQHPRQTHAVMGCISRHYSTASSLLLEDPDMSCVIILYKRSRALVMLK